MCSWLNERFKELIDLWCLRKLMSQVEYMVLDYLIGVAIILLDHE